MWQITLQANKARVLEKCWAVYTQNIVLNLPSEVCRWRIGSCILNRIIDIPGRVRLESTRCGESIIRYWPCFICLGISLGLALALVTEQISSPKAFSRMMTQVASWAPQGPRQNKLFTRYIVSFMEQSLEFLTDERRVHHFQWNRWSWGGTVQSALLGNYVHFLLNTKASLLSF